jgi:hypothetical protein
MAEAFPESGLEVVFCEHCIYGKQSWVKFPSEVTRENGILELVHSDVFGSVTGLYLVNPYIMSPS